MWKQHLQPTKSTKAKSKEPDNVRERIQSLSQALSGLKEEIKIETTTTAQNMERLEKQQFGTLHSQVFALKKAFTDLADAMLEEVEGVRSDYRVEISEFKNEVSDKIGNLAETDRNTSESCNKVNSSLTQSIKQAFQHIQGLKNQQDSIFEDIQSLKDHVSAGMTKQNEFCTRIEHVLEANFKEISKMFKEQADIRVKISEIETMPKQLSYVIEKEKERVKAIEDRINKEVGEIDRKMKTLSKDFEGVMNRKEIQDIKNSYVDLGYKSEENLREMKRQLLQMSSDIDTKWEEFRKSQENFNDYICNEIKSTESSGVIVRRLEFLEELTTTQRREIFNSITHLEQSAYKRHEKVLKAMHQLSRHLDIPEALLMI